MRVENNELIYEASETKSNECPVCGHYELKYGCQETFDHCIVTDWDCPACGAAGQEHDKLVYDGHVVTRLPVKEPNAEIYADNDGNLYFVRGGIGPVCKGFRRWKNPSKGARKEGGIPGLPYTEDRAIAQYQLDAYARKKGLHPATMADRVSNPKDRR